MIVDPSILSPLQAIKYEDEECGLETLFLHYWLRGQSIHEYGTEEEFRAFAAANPDEPEHTVSDGTVRKDHYGSGRQPWDDIVDQGWAAQYAAGNVLKYLRRTKQPETSLKKAQWFWERLHDLGAKEIKGTSSGSKVVALIVQRQLIALLTQEEREQLIGPEAIEHEDNTGQEHPFGFDKNMDVA